MGGVATAGGIYRSSLRGGGLPEARGVVISPATADKQVRNRRPAGTQSSGCGTSLSS